MNLDAIQKAIEEGRALAPSVAEEKAKKVQAEADAKAAETRRAQEAEQAYADKMLAELPARIKTAVANGEPELMVCSSERSGMQSGWYGIVWKALNDMPKELGFAPRIGRESGEDWNSFDTGYARHWSYDYIAITLPKANK